MEDIDLLCQSVERLLSHEIDPHRDRLDLYPRRPLPFDILATLSSVGLLEMARESAELSRPDNVVRLLLEMSEHCAGVAAIVACATTGELLRQKRGTDVAPGGLVALCLFEDDDLGLEDGGMQLATALDGDRVTGRKRSVTLAPRADLFAVVCRSEGHDCLAWIAKDSSGLEVGAPLDLIGVRVQPSADVTFDGCTVLAVQPFDMSHLTWFLALASLFTAACACGTAAAALTAAGSYAAERYQGGRRIEAHDAVKLLLAKSQAAVWTARAGVVEAARGFDNADAATWAQAIMAKVAASQATVGATLDAIQVLGGYGYMRDYGVEKRLRDAVALSLFPLDSTRLSLLVAGQRLPPRS